MRNNKFIYIVYNDELDKQTTKGMLEIVRLK